ncbi:unknown protein [Nostoc sp. NIES-3756]|uniref:C2 family cysteine protease n=1 Tax=Nostoc sp. NIES-3756 TaxID=1751286 RepID=UPI00071F8DDB|nr:C2 family cysteine protease [Nostoc sp. NIES-3756]BAT54381.1 unknown protein [Nostoc sp. NIES-3756]
MAIDKAGNTLSNSQKITFNTKTQTISDWVGSSDINDFYSFSLSSHSSVSIAMDGLSANADLQLLKDNNSNNSIDKGDVIASSNKGGTLSESISETLNAGNYFIRVYSKSGDTKYDLKFSPTSSNSSEEAAKESSASSNTVNSTLAVTNADWFSQNLSDQKIISLARNLASDSKLSRQDMLDIFRNVQDNSVVDSNEVEDLKALVAAGNKFNMEDHVEWLSAQVANGASAGMSASSFESNLVGRWFLGTVAPKAEFNGKKLTYTEVKGNLFGSTNKAEIGDIHQGIINDCTFLAALGATFSRQSDDSGNASSSVINSMIKDNGDNTYTVRFYSGAYYAPGEAQYVTVDRRIVTSIAAQRNDGVLWVALVEKAYAQWREWKDGRPGYNIIGNGGALAPPLSFITGRKTTNYSASKINFSTLETALKAGKAITTSRSGKDTSFILGSHAYSVTNAYISASGEQRVVVRNPWGVDGKAKSGANDGFINLSYKEFINSFNLGVSVS